MITNNNIYIHFKLSSVNLEYLLKTIFIINRNVLFFLRLFYYHVYKYQLHDYLRITKNYLIFVEKKNLIKKTKRWSILRSPHVNKNAQESFYKSIYTKHIFNILKYNINLNKKLIIYFIKICIYSFIFGALKNIETLLNIKLKKILII